MTSTAPAPRARRPIRLAAALVAAALTLVACSGPGSEPRTEDSRTPSASPTPEAVRATVSPAPNATGVAPATPVVVELARGRISAVSVMADSGDVVDGTLAPDGTRWTSTGKLAFGATYRVQVTGEAGRPPFSSTFTTAPVPAAGQSVRASSILGDNRTYGVGMPIILRLNRSIRDSAQRAAFEKALSVRSTPAVTGAWGWVSGQEVHFRPSAYWPAGARVHVGVDTAGRSLGGGLWGRTDLTVDFRIGTARRMIADASTHQMQVYENRRLVRTIPVSLGKPTFPSSSGTMVIIDKRPTALFDSSTYGLAVDSPDGYRTRVQYPMRLTWGGEFIHSAPWSVGDQGRRNVSHGCINVGPANAQWLYQRVRIGDPVTVRNTGRQVVIGNGYSDWSVDYPTWLKRSAAGSVTTA